MICEEAALQEAATLLVRANHYAPIQFLPPVTTVRFNFAA